MSPNCIDGYLIFAPSYRTCSTGCLLAAQLWWAVEDLNLGPLACEASALTTELTARLGVHIYGTKKRPLTGGRYLYDG